MKRDGLFIKLLKLIKYVILIDSVILLVVGGVYLIKGGWTFVGYSDTILIIAGIALILGLANLLGNFWQRGNFKYQYAATTTFESINKRIEDNLRLNNHSIIFFIVMLCVSITLGFASQFIIMLEGSI